MNNNTSNEKKTFGIFNSWEKFQEWVKRLTTCPF